MVKAPPKGGFFGRRHAEVLWEYCGLSQRLGVNVLPQSCFRQVPLRKVLFTGLISFGLLAWTQNRAVPPTPAFRETPQSGAGVAMGSWGLL